MSSSVTEPDQPVRLPLCVVRHGETPAGSLPLVYNSSFSDHESDIYKNYSQVFEQGVSFG